MSYQERNRPRGLSETGVGSDSRAGVKIGEVFNGYFNSSETARSFCELGLARIVPQLPNGPRVADFGGGDGHLAANVRDFLQKEGKDPAEVWVVDGNQKYLDKAKGEGLSVMQADLSANVGLSGLDLIISRATMHYNPLEGQAAILQNVRRSLKRDGVFVNQISSGDKFNTTLRTEIAALPSLGRASKGTILFITPEEYISLADKAGFETQLVGYAPSNSWTLEKMFNRFNPNAPKESRDRFLADGIRVIRKYVETTSIQGVDLTDESARVTYQYPIFASRPRE